MAAERGPKRGCATRGGVLRSRPATHRMASRNSQRKPLDRAVVALAGFAGLSGATLGFGRPCAGSREGLDPPSAALSAAQESKSDEEYRLECAVARASPQQVVAAVDDFAK